MCYVLCAMCYVLCAMCYIFEKPWVQGPQRQCSRVSDMPIQIHNTEYRVQMVATIWREADEDYMESGVKEDEEDMWIMLLNSGRGWCPNGSQRRRVRGQGSADRHSCPGHLERGQWWWGAPWAALEGYLGGTFGCIGDYLPWGGLVRSTLEYLQTVRLNDRWGEPWL